MSQTGLAALKMRYSSDSAFRTAMDGAANFDDALKLAQDAGFHVTEDDYKVDTKAPLSAETLAAVGGGCVDTAWTAVCSC